MMSTTNLTNPSVIWYRNLETSERLNEYEVERAFDDAMLEAYGEVEVCGVFLQAIFAFKGGDPIGYRCALSDWTAENFEELSEMDQDQGTDEPKATPPGGQWETLASENFTNPLPFVAYNDQLTALLISAGLDPAAPFEALVEFKTHNIVTDCHTFKNLPHLLSYLAHECGDAVEALATSVGVFKDPEDARASFTFSIPSKTSINEVDIYQINPDN